MAGYTELSTRRGRLFYARHPPDVPRGYFRTRTSRPHVLRVTSPAGNTPELDYTPQGRRKTLIFFKLAGSKSKESAKRFLRLISSVPEGESSESASPPASDTWSTISASTSSTRGTMYGDARRNSNLPPSAAAVAAPTQLGAMAHRPSLTEDLRTTSGRSASSTSSSASKAAVAVPEKPIASGNGLAVSIQLAEPMLFLQGYDQHDVSTAKTAMLRGSLKLRVSKNAKIKTISLKFRGRASTEWPEGIPPRKTEFKDTESLMNHTWTFFNFRFPNADGHCADDAQVLKGPRTITTEVTRGAAAGGVDQPFGRLRTSTTDTLSPKELKRLSLSADRSRSFGKGDAQTFAGTKGYRTFTPGVYTYNFELPIDSRMPETINVELGSVKYELEAIVERSGAFRANLIGTKDIALIRAPSENSLETVEPIAISRDWEDQLHYDIVISGKSFPLGAQVPIAFKLTPLAKVQCHRIKVFVTENIQYFTKNKGVHRLEPTRKIQLLEKRADGPSTSAYPGSTVRIMSGGGVAYDSRAAAAAGDESVERDTSNLLGNLDGEHNVGPTEMEFSVQLPSCHIMQEKERAARIHFDTTYQNIQVNHWIKIVMRLSKPDAVDPNKRRHFEISIDSPFNILSCRATQANTSLPAYTSPDSATLLSDYLTCGCPGAPRDTRNTSSLQFLGPQPSFSSTSLNSTTVPSFSQSSPSAHIHDSQTALARPIHLLRAPSFNPPAWSNDDMPPPLVTPPPDYNSLVQGDPRNGLADYFARLAADEGGDENDGVSLASRIEMPLTPGGRINRSMDERRTWLPVGGSVGSAG